MSGRGVAGSVIGRFPRLSYFVAGVAVAASSFWFLVSWFDIFNETLGLDVVFDTRPGWLRALMSLAAWLPLIALERSA